MSEMIGRKTPEISSKLEQELRSKISEWLPELAGMLPGVSLDAEISFDNRRLIPDTGTGGFALEPKHIALAFNSDFRGDKTEQMRNFKGSLFHEYYHLVQGFVGSDEKLNNITALENAIYEGAATKFEVLKAGTHPGWSQYPDEVEDWVREIATLGNSFDIGKWKFYDPETTRRWIIYRSGCYIVDQAMLKTGESIENLAKIPPLDIFKMSGIELQ